MLKTNAQIVAALTDQYPQIKTRGFLKELREAFAGQRLRHNCIRGFNRVPDGYVIDAQDKESTCLRPRQHTSSRQPR